MDEQPHDAMPGSLTEALARIIDREQVEAEDARWRARAEDPRLRAVLLGPYNAGKSSLLKRLLAEEGAPIPDGLAVSARPETAVALHAVAGVTVFIDTPGVASGAEQDESVAFDEVASADVLLLVMPPALFAGSLERMVPVLTGENFGLDAATAWPPGSILLVLARADTIGADPVESPEDYAEGCARKRRELERLWRAHIGGTEVPDIHIVAADAGAAVDDTPRPTLGQYERAEWDGVQNLRRNLADAVRKRSALRAAAARRHWGRTVQHAVDLARDEDAYLAAMIDEAQARQEALALLQKRVDALEGHALADLDASLHDAVRVLTEETLEDAAHVTQQAVVRFSALATAWTALWGGDLEKLARDGGHAIDVGTGGTAKEAYRVLVAALLEHPAPSPTAAARAGVSAHSTVSKGSAAAVKSLLVALPRFALILFEVRNEMPAADLGLLAGQDGRSRQELSDVFTAAACLSAPSGPDDDHRPSTPVDPWLLTAAEIGVVLIAVGRTVADKFPARRDKTAEAPEPTVTPDQAVHALKERILADAWRPAVDRLRAEVAGCAPPGSLIEGLRNRQAELRRTVAALGGTLD